MAVIDTIYVIVNKPEFDALASEDTVCPGVTVTLEIDTANAQYLSQGINYNYSWFPPTIVGTSTAQTTTATAIRQSPMRPSSSAPSERSSPKTPRRWVM